MYTVQKVWGHDFFKLPNTVNECMWLLSTSVIETSLSIYLDTDTGIVIDKNTYFKIKRYNGKKLNQELGDLRSNTSTHYMTLGKLVNLYGLSYCHL